jgi:hypothetical protein
MPRHALFSTSPSCATHKDEEKEAMLQEYLAFEQQFGGKPELTLEELKDMTLQSAPPVCVVPPSRH